MTTEAFRDALAKGQGRAALVASKRDPNHTDAIVEACLHDRRFEPVRYKPQVPYLHYIVVQARLERIVRDAVLTALPRTPEGRDRQGMIDLLALFARTGDAQAFEALLPLAEAGDRRAQDGLATSGDPGLEWCVEHILPRYAPEEQGFVWKWLINGGWDDRTPTRKRLRIIREESMARAKTSKTSSKPNPYFVKDPVASTPGLFCPPPGLHVPHAYPWLDTESSIDGKDAARVRELVASWRQRKARWGVKNAMPMPDEPLRTEIALLMLGEIDSPEARAFGLELIERSPFVPRALNSLRSSAESGDIPAVLAFLVRAEGEPDRVRNAVAFDAENLARTKWDRAWQSLAEWTYERALSAEVRGSAFDWIVRVGKPSRTMLQEALYDVESYTRNLAGERSRKPEAPFLALAGAF